MASDNDDPYDTSSVNREWDRLKNERRLESEREKDKSRLTLEEVAKTDSNAKVRIAAVNRLQPQSSKSTLEFIAKYDKDPDVRAAATSRLLG